MKRLLLLTIGLLLLTLLGLITTLTVTHAQRATPAAFSLCAGRPCYRGISPGVTTWDQAKQRFGTAADERFTQNFAILHSVEHEAPINFYSHGAVVGFITAYYWKAKPPMTVGSLIAVLGTPCAVRVIVDEHGQPTYLQAVHYASLTILVGYLRRLKAETPITAVNMYKPEVGDQCVGNATAQAKIMPWRGFVSVNHYAVP